jgi:hypothetical protein
VTRSLFDAAVRFFGRVADERLFERLDGGGERLIEREPNLGFCRGVSAGTVRREARISGDSSDGVTIASGSARAMIPAYFVGQLADVAGPRVEQEVLEGLVAQCDAAISRTGWGFAD